MKEKYQKPVLVRRETLSTVAAGPGSPIAANAATLD
jgi:hypothetical protein